MNRYLLDTDIFSKWAGEEEPVSSIVESQPIKAEVINTLSGHYRERQADGYLLGDHGRDSRTSQ